MLGRRSLRRQLVFDPEPEIILRRDLPRVEMAGQRSLKEYFIPTNQAGPALRRPGGDNPYEIKSSTISLLPSFYGTTREDPYRHIEEFTEVCSTMKLQGVIDDAQMRTLFPFSLKDKAKYWYHTLDNINTWDALKKEFLKKYFPMSKTNHFRREIMSFVQKDGEAFHDKWERFNDLLRLCPHH